MTWVCPYCGQENWNEDRIAFQEPCCHRCRQERTTPEGLRKKLDEEVKEIKEDLHHIRSTEMIREEISSLENDLAELKCELADILEERKPYIERLKEIKNMKIYTEAERTIPKDQRKLDLGMVTEN